ITRESYAQAGTGGGFELSVSNTGKLRLDTYQSPTAYTPLVGNTTITTGVWHHVAGVFDGSQMRLYVDGVLDATLSTTNGPASGTSSLKIGKTSYGSYFGGLIDEARVSNSAVYTSNFTPLAHLTSGSSTKGLWKFDGQSTSDSSGNSNNGTLQSSATYSTDVPTGPSTSYYSGSFNGSGAYVQVPNSSSLNITGAITVEAWIKVNAITAAYQDIITRESYAQAGTGGGFELSVSNTGKLRLDTYQSPTAYTPLVGNTTITTGVWHHVAGVFDGSQMRLYVDGVLDATLSTTNGPASGTSSLKIGKTSYGSYFGGLIDEARVSNSAVYTSNFTPLAHLTSGSSTKGLWKFDGQSTSDSSGNSNNGTLQSSATYSTDVPTGPSTSYYSGSFNGSGAYVQVPNSSSLNITGAITVEAWIKVNAITAAYQDIITRESYAQAGTGGGFELSVSNTGKLRLDTYQSPTAYTPLVGNTTITTGVWHHVAGVFDGSQMRLYVDGVLDATLSTTNGPASGTSSLKIGKTSYGSYFGGLIDEARVSNSAVYTSNFTPLAHLTSGSSTKGLWKFDGQSTSDSSGNSNNGTLQSSATYSTDVPTGPSTSYYSGSFNGSGAYVQVPNSSSLNITGAITVEAWIKVNAITAAYQDIITRESYAQAGTGGGFELSVSNTGKLRLDTYQSPTAYTPLVGNTTITTGVWHHVAGVFDGSQMRLYVDGVLDATLSTTNGPASGTSSLKIGKTSYGSYFGGLIDEARVSNSAVYTSNFTPLAHLTSGSSTKGLWKFDGQSTSDSSGNSNNGTLQSSATYSTDVPTGPSTSYYSGSFNGSGAYVQVPNSSSLNITGAITVEAWIKVNAITAAYQDIITRESYAQAGTGGGFELSVSNTGKLRLDTYQSPTAYTPLVGNTTITTGVWHHVAGVFDGSQMRLYVDGVLDATLSTTNGPASGTSSLKIGKMSYGSYFGGLIDEARVSNSAVYTSNFTPLAHLTSGSSTKGLWKFDGQSTSDSSGNSNNGTLQSSATYSTDVPTGPSTSYYSGSFNGSGAYVQVPNSSSLNITGAITVEAWIKVNAITAAYQD